MGASTSSSSEGKSHIRPHIIEGYFCVAFRSRKDFDVIHATKDVQDVFRRAIIEMWHNQGDPYEAEKNGVLQFELPGEDDILQALFAIKVFEDLSVAGYDIVTSACLDVTYYGLTWYFRKVTKARPFAPVLAITTSGTNGMFIVRGSGADVNIAIKTAIAEAWPFGIHSEKKFDYDGAKDEQVQYYKLTGNPWRENHMAIELVRQTIGRLGQINWKLLSNSNFNKTTDVLFFIQDSKNSPTLEDLATIRQEYITYLQ